jgi:hypothetical protein
MGTPVQLALLSVIVAAGSAAAYIVVKRSHKSPAERERHRRVTVNSLGRLIEGVVMEVKEETVYYAYSWRGIDYETSQDLTALSALLPSGSDSLAGPVTVKFLPRNPYNSIVLCEAWSGFPKNKTARMRGECRND